MFSQNKDAKSIDHFAMDLLPSNQVQMFDLRQFVQSNQSLQELLINQPDDRLTPDQVEVLHRTVAACPILQISVHLQKMGKFLSLSERFSNRGFGKFSGLVVSGLQVAFEFEFLNSNKTCKPDQITSQNPSFENLSPHFGFTKKLSSLFK
jgi:hypothetical protein